MAKSSKHSLVSKKDSVELINTKFLIDSTSNHVGNGTDQQNSLESDKKFTSSQDLTLSVTSEVRSRLTFNVGGVIFQTFESTVKNMPIVNDLHFRSHYDEVRKEYFFDRDPEVFRSVLNFWRTGKLHLPAGRCGPSINNELEFWGLGENHIQPCCWNYFNTGLDTVASLEKLRRDTLQDDEMVLYLAEPGSFFGRARRTLWYVMTTPSHSIVAKIYAVFSIFMALLSIFSFCASTSTPFVITPTVQTNTNVTASDDTYSTSRIDTDMDTDRATRVHPALIIIDYICLAFFTLEYLVRLLCAPKMFRFFVSLSAVIDLLAIIPDYVIMIVHAAVPDGKTGSVTDLLLLLRLMRVLRIFRIVRRVPGLWVMMYTMKASYKELSLLLLFLLMGTLLFASIIYFIDDPDVFTSIPQSFWWAIVTMTTVGYGDMVPKTPWGQLVGSVTTICGVLLVGFTIPSLVNNFLTYYSLVQYDRKQRTISSSTKTMTTESAVDTDSSVCSRI